MPKQSDIKSPSISEKVQSNFCFGELSPDFQIDSHLEQYEVSVSELRNMLISSSGKIESRPTFLKIKEFRARHSNSRILPIVLDGDILGVLLLSRSFIHLYKSFQEGVILYKKIKLPVDLKFNKKQLNSVSFVQTARYGYLAAKGHALVYFPIASEDKEPVKAVEFFSDIKDAPSKLAIYNNRLWCGSSMLSPAKWWVSKVAGHLEPYSNEGDLFNEHSRRQGDLYSQKSLTVRDMTRISEAFWFEHSINQTSYVKWILPNKYLNFSTGFKEYSVRPVDVAKILSNENIKILDETNIGSAEIDPIFIDNEIIFVDASRRKICLLIAETAQHSVQKAIEISYFSSHLFKGSKISRIIYQKSPYGIIWVLLEDGTLVSLTYNSQQKILGWARHQIKYCFVVDIASLSLTEGDIFILLVLNNKTGKHSLAKLNSLLEIDNNIEWKDLGEYPIHCKLKTHNFLKDEEKKRQRLYSAQVQKLGIYTTTKDPIGSINGVKIDPKKLKDGYVEVQAPRHYTKSVELTYEAEVTKPMTITGVHAIFSKKITN